MNVRKVTHRDYIRNLFKKYANLVKEPHWGMLVESKNNQQDKLNRLLQLDQETCSLKDVENIIGIGLTTHLCSCCGKRITFYFEIESDEQSTEICFECINNMNRSISIEDMK